MATQNKGSKYGKNRAFGKVYRALGKREKSKALRQAKHLATGHTIHYNPNTRKQVKKKQSFLQLLHEQEIKGKPTDSRDGEQLAIALARSLKQPWLELKLNGTTLEWTTNTIKIKTILEQYAPAGPEFCRRLKVYKIFSWGPKVEMDISELVAGWGNVTRRLCP